MKHVTSIGGVIINLKMRKAVLVLQDNGAWTLPKGGPKKGESKVETLKREIYEETGIVQYDIIEELNCYKRPAREDPSRGYMKTLCYFLCTTEETKLQPHADDAIDTKWVSIDDVATQLSYKRDQDFFLSLRDEILLLEK